MNKRYNEKHFCIDLIVDAYKTNKPSFISLKIKEDLNENVSPSEVYDYLNHTEDFEKASNSVAMSDIFDRDAYEAQRDEDLIAYMRHEA